MARRVQSEDIVAINEAYAEIGTYAGAARATGWSAGTVKRYIIPNYTPQNERVEIERIEVELLPLDELSLPSDWNDYLQLTEKEQEKCEKLRKSIIV